MIESVMMDQEEIKDDQQQQGTTEEEEEEEEDSSTDLVVPTETTVILVDDDDDDDGRRVERSKETGFEMSKEEEQEEVSAVDKLKANVVVEEEEESEKSQTTTTCVIDVKCNVVGGNCDVEKVCRICHLSADPPPPPPSDNNNSDTMIQLGCGCKGELGIAHRHCAETWFKLKGNRCCEICGEAAKNITGMWDDRFMEDWNDRRSVGSNSLDRRWGFWRGQPFCNFLMACLVMAFVLPWFFRVNMF